jgi:hypothetical protein
MVRAHLAVSLVFLLAACTVERAEPPTPTGVDEETRDEIVDMLEGYFQVFIAGHTDALRGYLQPGCSEEDVQVILRESEEAAAAGARFGITYGLTIDREKLIMNRRGARIIVPAQQPAGVATFTFNGTPTADEEEPSANTSVELVRSLDGRRQIVNCDDVAADLARE